jgi:L,D-peptidoglycan transpeptidase YkuD (ErfK/YbiS/YcfS/YnhG family)
MSVSPPVSSPVLLRSGLLLAATLFSTGLLLSGCAGAPAPVAVGGSPTATHRKVVDRDGHGRSAPRPGAARAGEPMAWQEIPSLGPGIRRLVPDSAEQAVVVIGEGHDANRSTVVLYSRDLGSGWQRARGPWPARNALHGWSAHHRIGDLRSPEGVYGLTDAGGRRPDPGTRLPYDRNSVFVAPGTGFNGESLAGAFDYVVAINYNRESGTTPLDWTRPLGAERGGGVWFHVDHGGPTHGCVSLPESRMKELLRWLDPAKKPVVVMGDAAALRR